MNIHYISYFLSEEGMKAREHTFECTKTPSGYKVNKASNFGGKTTLVKDADILKAECLTRTDVISTIHCFTFYLNESDKYTAKGLLRDYLTRRATDAKELATKVYDTLIETLNKSNTKI